MSKVVYPGTFDPFTNGHFDILKRALELFDEVVILVAAPPTKKPFLSVDDRLALLKEILGDYKQVTVDTWDGLIVDYLKKHNLRTVVRGLRPTGDFESEFQMASMNRQLFEYMETVFLATGEEFYFVSSSLIREILSHGGDISEFVPKEVFQFLNKEN